MLDVAQVSVCVCEVPAVLEELEKREKYFKVKTSFWFLSSVFNSMFKFILVHGLFYFGVILTNQTWFGAGE